MLLSFHTTAPVVLIEFTSSQQHGLCALLFTYAISNYRSHFFFRLRLLLEPELPVSDGSERTHFKNSFANSCAS